MVFSLTKQGRSNVLKKVNSSFTNFILFLIQRFCELTIFSVLISEYGFIRLNPFILTFLLIVANISVSLIKIILAMIIKGNDSFSGEAFSPLAHYISVNEKLAWYTSDTIWHMPFLWVCETMYWALPLWISTIVVSDLISFWELFFYLRTFYAIGMSLKMLVIFIGQRLDYDMGFSYDFTRSFTFDSEINNTMIVDEVEPHEDISVVKADIEICSGGEIFEIRSV